MNINNRVREIISHLQISDRQFAIHIGVNQSVIGSMFSRGTEPSAKILTSILDKCPEISAEWLMRGKGEMLLASEQPTDAEDRMNKLIDTITFQQDTIKNLQARIKELEAELIINRQKIG